MKRKVRPVRYLILLELTQRLNAKSDPFCCAGTSTSVSGPEALSEKELQQIAVADVQRQVAGVETVYRALMAQVSKLSFFPPASVLTETSLRPLCGWLTSENLCGLM